MPSNILTTSSKIQCPHGGQVILSTSNTKVYANSEPVLLESDTHQVVGCPFNTGSNPSPCIIVVWSGGASMVTIDGTPVLIQTSTGKCYNAQNVPQGITMIVDTQASASAQ
jgi:uncharacterized Zn-binding protein involved in type VI secretion